MEEPFELSEMFLWGVLLIWRRDLVLDLSLLLETGSPEMLFAGLQRFFFRF
jgi:hypothetical protein